MKFFLLRGRRLWYDAGYHIGRYRFFYLGLLGFFIAGVAVGLFVESAAELLFVERALDYFLRLFGGGFGFFSHFFSRLLTSLQFVLIVSLFSLHVFCIPLQLFYIVYRGFILGTAAKTIVTIFSLTGVINLIVIIVPMQIAVMFVLFFCCITGDCRSYACYKCRDYYHFWRSMPEFLEVLLQVAVVSALICLAECLLIAVIIFPLNSVFL